MLASFVYMGGRGEERTVIKKNDATGPSQLFDQFITLRIIFLHSLLVPIIEGRILSRPFEELEASSVECSKVFLASQVLDDDSVISMSIVPLPFTSELVLMLGVSVILDAGQGKEKEQGIYSSWI